MKQSLISNPGKRSAPNSTKISTGVRFPPHNSSPQVGECSKALKTIKIQPSGNGWLIRSAVATLRRKIEITDLKSSISKEKLQFTDVRSMGGRHVLITFPSSENRDSIINSNLWEIWFSSITPWNGEAAGKERFAWLSCTGIPLNAWDMVTFKLIAENWGTFMEVDANTLKYLSFEKGRIMVATTLSQNFCPLCSELSETPQHLLLHCSFAWRIWSSIFRWWRVEWVCPPDLITLSLFWFSSPFKNLEKKCWESCFYAVIWSIWKARNDLIFNNKASTWEEITELVKIRVALWIKGLNDLRIYSVNDFLGNLDAIRRIKI